MRYVDMTKQLGIKPMPKEGESERKWVIGVAQHLKKSQCKKRHHRPLTYINKSDMRISS